MQVIRVIGIGAEDEDVHRVARLHQRQRRQAAVHRLVHLGGVGRSSVGQALDVDRVAVGVGVGHTADWIVSWTIWPVVGSSTTVWAQTSVSPVVLRVSFGFDREYQRILLLRSDLELIQRIGGRDDRDRRRGRRWSSSD